MFADCYDIDTVYHLSTLPIRNISRKVYIITEKKNLFMCSAMYRFVILFQSHVQLLHEKLTKFVFIFFSLSLYLFIFPAF